MYAASTGNYQAFGQLMGDDYLTANADGSYENKEQALEKMKKNPLPKLDTMERSNPLVRQSHFAGFGWVRFFHGSAFWNADCIRYAHMRRQIGILREIRPLPQPGWLGPIAAEWFFQTAPGSVELSHHQAMWRAVMWSPNLVSHEPGRAGDLFLVEKADGLKHQPPGFGTDLAAVLQRAMYGRGAELGLFGDLADGAETLHAKGCLESHVAPPSVLHQGTAFARPQA